MKNPEIVGAIVVGSCIIAVGLYFGLKGRASESPGHANPNATMIAHLSAQAPQPTSPQKNLAPAAPGLAPTTASPEITKAVMENVSAEIEKARPEMLEKCWRPSAAKNPKPEKVRLVFNGTISKEGKAIAFGLSEDRAASRPDINECLSVVLAHTTVAAPGVSTQVSVELFLP